MVSPDVERAPLPPGGGARFLLEALVAGSPIANPGVKFPPPFLFVAGFLVGWLIHRQWPVPLLPRASARVCEVAGWAALAMGLGVILWAFATFLRRRTAIYPNQPATQIVRDGPYRWTRNPMYLSLTSMYLGLALLINSVVPILVLPVVLILLVSLVIRREERYLQAAFPGEYGAYCADVRRWL